MSSPKFRGWPLLGLVLSIGALPGLLAFLRWPANDHQQEVDYHRNLRLLRTLDARLNVEILRLRSGLTANYDALGGLLNETKQVLVALAVLPSFVGVGVAASFRSSINELQQQLVRKRELVESFKTHNALLRNSQHFVPIAVERLRGQSDVDEQVRHRADVLVARVMLLNVDASPGVLEKLLQAAAELGSSTSDPDGTADSRLVEKHARMIGEHQPVVDELVRHLLESRFSSIAGHYESLYSRQYRSAMEERAIRERVVLTVWVLGVTVALGGIIVRLRRDARAMLQASEQLQRVNEALAEEHEKERSIGEMRVQFVSMTSHEFRTPLSAIHSSAELLQRYGERWEFARQVVHFARIRAAARDMAWLLDEILLIGRAEAGILAATFGPMNLDELCREVVETIRQTSSGSHMLVLSLRGDPNVILDERLTRHMLTNLLGNAIKYSPAGSTVELRVEVQDEFALVSVCDQGIGIPTKDLPTLFTGFRRGSNVGTIGGSGLGLAVVKRVVEALSGSISVASVEGQGTEFRVQLRLRRPTLDERWVA